MMDQTTTGDGLNVAELEATLLEAQIRERAEAEAISTIAQQLTRVADALEKPREGASFAGVLTEHDRLMGGAVLALGDAQVERDVLQSEMKKLATEIAGKALEAAMEEIGSTRALLSRVVVAFDGSAEAAATGNTGRELVAEEIVVQAIDEARALLAGDGT